MILTSSDRTTVTLQDELVMLELYLKMEQLRFSNSFEYNIQVSKDLEPGSVMVPPLLLQPVCENAIWHGLSHRKNKGKLDINIHETGRSLRFVVTDNGSGRKKPNVNEDGGHKPMGIKLTADRVALFNGEKNDNSSYEIEDLVDENGQPTGTKVFIRLKNYEWNGEPVLSTSNESDHNR
jgi:LytS/YehU family sensor histidine kinase